MRSATDSRALGAWGEALRPHHWVKNILLLVPLVAAHELDDAVKLGQALVAVLCFALTASAGYILNDLRDAEADRRHPGKRARPFAAGVLTGRDGLVAIPLLLAVALLLALLLLPGVFAVTLAVYFAGTAAYSLALKRIVLLDVLTLAGLYTWRIIAGGVAVDVVPSFWLLALSVFLFFSLALVKRYAELRTPGDRAGELNGRGYRSSDRPLLLALGLASGFAAVQVLALYIQSQDSALLYRDGRWLWALCPLAMYWISRIWLIAFRGAMDDDPMVFALRDPVSWVAGLAGIGVLWAAL